MNKRIEVRAYIQNILKTEVEERFLTSSAIILTEDDPKIVCDILVLVSNEKYQEFANRYGSHFVVNDHSGEYPVFTKFRNNDWMENDLKSRPPIALWIYQNSSVVQDPQGEFAKLLDRYQLIFQKNLTSLIKRKYIELRTERHNLRQAIRKNRKMAISLIKATVVKLAMEISLLADNRPYPYKKWLPEDAKNIPSGMALYPIAEAFLNEADGEKIITISEEIIARIQNVLSKTCIPNDLLNRWWLYLE